MTQNYHNISNTNISNNNGLHSSNSILNHDSSSSTLHIPSDALPLQKVNLLITDDCICVFPTVKSMSGRWLDSKPVRKLQLAYFRSERILQEYLIFTIEDAMRNSQRKKAWPEQSIDQFSGDTAEEIKNSSQASLHITWFDFNCVCVKYHNLSSGGIEEQQFCNDENFGLERIAEYVIAKLPEETKSEDSLMYSSDLEQPPGKRRRIG